MIAQTGSLHYFLNRFVHAVHIKDSFRSIACKICNAIPFTCRYKQLADFGCAHFHLICRIIQIAPEIKKLLYRLLLIDITSK